MSKYYDGHYGSPFEDPLRDEWVLDRMRAGFEQDIWNNPTPEVVKEFVEEGPDFLHKAARVKEAEWREVLEWRSRDPDSVKGNFWANCDTCKSSIHLLRASKVEKLMILESWSEVRPGEYDLVDVTATADVCCSRPGCKDPDNGQEDPAMRMGASIQFKRTLYSSDQYNRSRFDDATGAIMALKNSVNAPMTVTTRRLMRAVTDDTIQEAIRSERWVQERIDGLRKEEGRTKFTALDIMLISADLFGTTAQTDIGRPTFYSDELDRPHDETMIAKHSSEEDDRFIDPTRILSADELMGELDSLRKDMGFPEIYG